jgi:hypothetical protein
MPNEIEKLVSELPRDRRAFQKHQRRMYDCKTLQFDPRENLLIKGQPLPAFTPTVALNQRMRLLEIRRVARPPCFCQQSDVDVWYDDWKTPPGYSAD